MSSLRVTRGRGRPCLGQLETSRTFASFQPKTRKPSGLTPPRTPAEPFKPPTPPEWFPPRQNASKAHLARMRVQARELARGQQTEPPEQAATRRAELGAFVALATRNKKSTVRGEHATRRFKLAHTRSLLQERREQEGATARAARGKASLLMSQQVVAQHRAKQAARVAVLMEQGRKASEAAVRMHAIRERQAAEVRERKAKGRRVIRETHHARLAYYDLVRKPRPPADYGNGEEEGASRGALDAGAWLASLAESEDPPPTQSILMRAAH